MPVRTSKTGFLIVSVVILLSATQVLLADEAGEIDEIYRSEIKALNSRILDVDSAIQLRDADIAKLRKKIRDAIEEAQKLSALPGQKPPLDVAYASSQLSARYSEIILEQNAQLARKAELERKRAVYQKLRKDGIVTMQKIGERIKEINDERNALNRDLKDLQERQTEYLSSHQIDFSAPYEEQQAAYEKNLRGMEPFKQENLELLEKSAELNTENMILFGVSILDFIVPAQPELQRDGKVRLPDPNEVVEQMDKIYGYRAPDSPCDMSCYGGYSPFGGGGFGGYAGGGVAGMFGGGPFGGGAPHGLGGQGAYPVTHQSGVPVGIPADGTSGGDGANEELGIPAANPGQGARSATSF